MDARVLIVDDNERSRALLTAKLSSDGYTVKTASNGLEAIEMTHSFKPDLILLDIMMPKMDGFETCRKLKADEEMRYIPVVMLTARSELEDKVLGLEVGAEDYIVKPFSIIEVSARVKSLLRMRKLQKELQEREKMAALGVIVDGIAHEIRNPLVTVGGMARRLYEHEDDEEHKRYAERIMQGVDRMERMMERVDEYKGVLTTNFTQADVNAIVTQAISEVETYIVKKKNITIERELYAGPIVLNVDETNLKIAVYNVLQNAVEAIEGDEGVIRVQTLKGSDNDFVIKVSDNGVGMDEDTLKNIFNPFFTSKMTGAGLGLSITYKIINDHNGIIEATSKPGEGSVFSITLRGGGGG